VRFLALLTLAQKYRITYCVSETHRGLARDQEREANGVLAKSLCLGIAGEQCSFVLGSG